MKRYDIAVIGGGASGLAAAISAKRTNRNLSVVITERLPKTGKKLLATGNGRCNLSNTDLSPECYHGSCKTLLPVTNNVSVPDFFKSLGVLCDDDGYGRIYPHGRSAASVLDALRLECAKLGITEICGSEVKKIETSNGFTIHSESDVITAHSVILAGGGKSQSALGSNGSLLNICADLGVKIVRPFPALVPLKTDASLVRPLKGQRADAKVTFCSRGKEISSKRGEVQFTDGLLSGICVFDLSYLYEQYKTDPVLKLDLLPDLSIADLKILLFSVRSIRINADADDFLSGIFTRPLGSYLIRRAVPEKLKTVDSINDNTITKIAESIKSLTFPVTGTAGYERSQVTGGGIIADELNDKFGIKRVGGLYACGELLDIFGDCGGYNLDFAFSSGIIAGRNAAL